MRCSLSGLLPAILHSSSRSSRLCLLHQSLEWEPSRPTRAVPLTAATLTQVSSSWTFRSSVFGWPEVRREGLHRVPCLYPSERSPAAENISESAPGRDAYLPASSSIATLHQRQGQGFTKYGVVKRN